MNEFFSVRTIADGRRKPACRPRGGSALFCIAATLASPWVARAQTGVSDDRVSLPDGPGSAEGMGDNAVVAGNMGLLTQRVGLDVPAGYAGMTPQLDLAYSSASGNAITGIGWSLAVPSIERRTLRGLPEYDADDAFAANGGDELVRVSASGRKRVYRARFEGAFIRYTWYDAGPAGYWTAEYPDGRVGYFGADADGRLVPDARLAGKSGETFRYHLVEVVDVHQHRLKYGWEKVEGVPYLKRIGYVYAGGGTRPRYEVELDYQPRPDHISDCKPGFEERIKRRLEQVRVVANFEPLRTYRLHYEDDAAAGGLSRLVRVEHFGRKGVKHPIVHTFAYSSALDGTCPSGDCDPFLVDMGRLSGGVAFQNGGATLLDINGDSLPDVVDTSADGAHRIFYNQLIEEGVASFSETATLSAVGKRAGFNVAQPSVQVLDLNGDGFADLANAALPGALCNLGQGDWARSGCGIEGGLQLELRPDEAGDADPLRTRFLDVDHDRRIDVIQTQARNELVVRRNTGAGFAPMAGRTPEPIGFVFDADRLELSDMNGDGLLDAVVVDAEGVVRHRLHLGFARWAPLRAMRNTPAVGPSERELLRLEDLNGDGLDDFVVVSGQTVRYALNRNGESYAPLQTIGSAGGGPLPTVTGRTTVAFADMNGSGSRDVVWIEATGEVHYLELFPVPPNLLSRVENGIGMVQTFTYGTAIEQRRKNPGGWTHPLPHSMNVVTRTDTWVTLTGGEHGDGLHEIITYDYTDGYYDGDNKQFRGFARIEKRELADASLDSQEPGRTVRTYHLGDEDAYYKGLMKTEEVFSTDEQGKERALQANIHDYQECSVAEAEPAANARAVRYVCPSRLTSVRKEGVSDPAEWATIHTTYTHDGYGNVTQLAELGVVHMGPPSQPQPCAPCASGAAAGSCGATCKGDESFVETSFVPPAERWLLRSPHVVRRYGEEGGLESRMTIYYDGPEFVGRADGSQDRGIPSRITLKRGDTAGDVIESERFSYDAHGNVLVSLDPLGSPDDPTQHRRTYRYDETGLRVVSTALHNTGAGGKPYRLVRNYTYHPVFDTVTSSSAWMVEGQGHRSQRNVTAHRYDDLGRRIATILPGDTEASPTIAFRYDYGPRISSITTLMRSAQGGELDIEHVRCLDGRGGIVQQRVKVEPGRYQVTGFTAFNSRGTPVRMYDAHTDSTSRCAEAPPTAVSFQTVRYDAAHRRIAQTLPDTDVYAARSRTYRRHLPLGRQDFDAEDADPDSVHAGTPTTTRFDGLGRTLSVVRPVDKHGDAPTTSLEYDGLGRVHALIDAAGHRKEQHFDLLGRLLRIDDPNTGTTLFSYDAAGNLLTRQDARGIVTRTEYDGLNRPVAQWDAADRIGTEIAYRYDVPEACASETCTNGEGQLVEISYPVADAVTALLGGPARGQDHLGYDSRGQATYEARNVAGIELVTRRAFDNAGRVVAEQHPDGRRIERTYDGGGRATGIPGFLERIDYDERGLPKQANYANGAVDAWGFDTRRRLRRLSTAAGNGVSVQDVAFEHDRVNNILTLTDAAAPPEGWPSAAATFEYDDWYRVTRAAHQGVQDMTWSYDAVDNVRRIERTASSGTVRTDAFRYHAAQPNAVAEHGAHQLTHDAAGYLTARDDLRFEWDHLGRLVRGVRDGKALAEFSYGAGMSRVATVRGNSITLYASRDFELRDGIGVTYVRVGDERKARVESDRLAAALLEDSAPVGEADGVIRAGDAWVAYAQQQKWLPGQRTSAASERVMLRAAVRRLLSESGDGKVMLHNDHLKNLVAATDRDGNVRGQRRYEMTSGSRQRRGFVDVYGFSGQEEFPELGLVRFRYRWLDVATQRWTRADPAFELTTSLTPRRVGEIADRYGYVANNPANFVDPTGLLTNFEKGILGLMVVATGVFIAVVAALSLPLAVVGGIAAVVAATIGAGATLINGERGRTHAAELQSRGNEQAIELAGENNDHSAQLQQAQFDHDERRRQLLEQNNRDHVRIVELQNAQDRSRRQLAAMRIQSVFRQARGIARANILARAMRTLMVQNARARHRLMARNQGRGCGAGGCGGRRRARTSSSGSASSVSTRGRAASH